MCSENVFAILAGTITPQKYSSQNVYYVYWHKLALVGEMLRTFDVTSSQIVETIYHTPSDH